MSNGVLFLVCICLRLTETFGMGGKQSAGVGGTTREGSLMRMQPPGATATASSSLDISSSNSASRVQQARHASVVVQSDGQTETKQKDSKHFRARTVQQQKGSGHGWRASLADEASLASDLMRSALELTIVAKSTGVPNYSHSLTLPDNWRALNNLGPALKCTEPDPAFQALANLEFRSYEVHDRVAMYRGTVTAPTSPNDTIWALAEWCYAEDCHCGKKRVNVPPTHVTLSPTVGVTIGLPPTQAPAEVTAGPQTMAPTEPQTMAPTELPTLAPTTELPTMAPTELQTMTPTEPQTEAPTEAQTEAPTEPQTEAQTMAPTEAQTEAPTEAQTEAPTEAQTMAPTEAQTEAPTEPQTEAPTEAQTMAPTEAQTMAPTEPQTMAPTEPQTMAPTEPQTMAPTAPFPTLSPTQPPVSPTAAPTVGGTIGLPPTQIPGELTPPAPTPAPTQPPCSLQPATGLEVCVFNPGNLGIKTDGMRVTEVVAGSVAERMGVMKDWQFDTINGEAFTVDMVQTFITGENSYTVTFRPEPGQPQTPAPTQAPCAVQPTTGLEVCVFNAGSLGIKTDGMRVTEVVPGSQAERMGVMKDWRWDTIDGEAFSLERCQAFIAGDVSYTVTFRPATGVWGGVPTPTPASSSLSAL